MNKKRLERWMKLKEIFIWIIVIVFFPCLLCVDLFFGKSLSKHLEEQWENEYEGEGEL